MSDPFLNPVSNVTESSSTPPPLHALLIGISNYASDEVKNLRGGVADATRFKEYLQVDLGVPDKQIIFLGDQQATRAAIIENLEKLKGNKAIKENDPIFIFYAGHGAREESALESAADAPNPVLGRCKLLSDTVRLVSDALGVKPLSDAIKLVSGALNPVSEAFEPVSDPPKPHEVLVPHDFSTLPGQPEIPAITDRELARLVNDIYRAKGDNIIEGAHRRRLFNIDFNAKPEGGTTAILRAGTAHGVDKGDRFAIYPLDYTDDNWDISPLGFLAVSKPSAYTSIMHDTSKFPLLGLQVAIKTSTAQRSDLRLYIPEDDKAHPQIQELIRKHQFRLWNIEIVNDEKKAHLELKSHLSKASDNEKDKVVIRVVETTVADFQSVNAVGDFNRDNYLVDVLQRAAHYFQQRHRQGDESISRSVKVEFYKLKENLDEDYDRVGMNLCKDGKVELIVEEENVPYGIKLINASKTDLFPSLFYFNQSDFSIVPFYVHPAQSLNYEVEPPLRKGESLTIGYGPLGAAPFTYDIPPRKSVDFGYLKIFLFTQAVSQVEDISQASPFSGERGAQKYKRPSLPIWGTITIPIIQRANY